MSMNKTHRHTEQALRVQGVLVQEGDRVEDDIRHVVEVSQWPAEHGSRSGSRVDAHRVHEILEFVQRLPQPKGEVSSRLQKGLKEIKTEYVKRTSSGGTTPPVR